MAVDGSSMMTTDPRMKFAVSVAGIRGSHDSSPVKNLTLYPPPGLTTQ